MTWYATLYLILRWPCEPFSCANNLRNFLHKLISPCELRQTWLCCHSSIRCFSHTTETDFAFLLIVGVEPTAYFLKGNHSTIELYLTYCDVLSQLLHKVLLYKIQHATYLLSCELLSRFLRPMYTYCYISINHSNCIRTLGCNPSNQYTTFSYTCWQVGFVLRSAPPVTLCPPVLPSREHKQTFFPTHLLYSYIHRSYQWTHPHGCKQACIDEPLLAQSCRRILLWAHRCAYSKEAMPPNSLYHIETH